MSGKSAAPGIPIAIMPAAPVAAGDSEWLGVVLVGFIIGPGLITVGIVYGVWKLGDRGNPNPDTARLKRSYDLAILVFLT